MNGKDQPRVYSITPVELFELTGPEDVRAAIAPALGCNCVSWRVAGRERLFAPPLVELAQRTTRGGVPILFPFPNRVRAGRFHWNGREYQLPCNDSTKANAIHGFTPRVAWNPLGVEYDKSGATFRAEFQTSRDAPDASNSWPADARLTIGIRLQLRSLSFEAVVESADDNNLPFGLGYHPYFAADPGDRVQTAARGRWGLTDGLPTGTVLPVDGPYDLRSARPVGDLTLDDVDTDFPPSPPEADGLVERGRLIYADGGALVVRTSPEFRELVLFTPQHRKAICLEPYTCPTDAVNLTGRGLDVGWQVVPPGQQWRARVEFRVE